MGKRGQMHQKVWSSKIMENQTIMLSQAGYKIYFKYIPTCSQWTQEAKLHYWVIINIDSQILIWKIYAFIKWKDSSAIFSRSTFQKLDKINTSFKIKKKITSCRISEFSPCWVWLEKKKITAQVYKNILNTLVWHLLSVTLFSRLCEVDTILQEKQYHLREFLLNPSCIWFQL